MTTPQPPLLDVRDLVVEFATRGGTVTAVKSVDLQVVKGETVGIVGESGSGKSVTSYALMRILDRAGRVAGGSIHFSGIDLIAAKEREMRDIRGREISMIFQNPRAALNPIRKVGRQIEDVLIEHAQAVRSDAKQKAIDLLRLVRINQPEARYNSYPFELSGGMCQRIVIAIALACRPRLLIADEPTTGLDVTTQKAIMDLVVELTRERGMSTILITHDLGLASAYCDKVLVMEQGRVVENARAETIFRAPEHPYTKRLMRATPRPGIEIRDLLPEDAEGLEADALARQRKNGIADNAPPILQVKDLVKEFPMANGSANPLAFWKKKAAGDAEKPPVFRAVDGISFSVGAGECLGLVGESGCGKSTTSSMVMRLLDVTSGSIEFEDRDIAQVPAKSFAHDPARPRLQMVFQDPTDSLNPRLTAFRSIADPLYRLAGMRGSDAVRAKAEQLADRVGLPRDLLDRFPHQLSGGQKARVGIARAIALDPRLLILDEPTAALDVSVQAVVLNLLVDLKRDLGMSYLFVSHDLQVVRLLCDRIIVMKGGRIIEEGPTEAVMDAPAHDYTRELIAAARIHRFDEALNSRNPHEGWDLGSGKERKQETQRAPMTEIDLTMSSLHAAYASGLSPSDMVDAVHARIEAAGDPGIFITLIDKDAVREAAAELGTFDPVAKPLWGVPFAVKDNIDVAGMVTTAACPEYAYRAEANAACVDLLLKAGAILIGKTNLDQFATGLVGMRSPYQPPLNAVDPELVPGGSSSGSAVAVSHGIVSFALGTDTAGSGRVPAALNNIVGLKPTLGAISTRGVVPACRTLDCVSIFATTLDDAWRAFNVMAKADDEDAFSRSVLPGSLTTPPVLRIGVPDQRSREFFGDEYAAQAFVAHLAALRDQGAELIEIDLTPFYDVAALLYTGPWVAERYQAIREFIETRPGALHPVTRAIIEPAAKITAADAFAGLYKLAERRRMTESVWRTIDMLAVPSVPTAYTVAEVEAEPILTNSRLGIYTNFVNLLDLCALAVPCAYRGDGRPAGLTLIAPRGRDGLLAGFGERLHEASGVTRGATGKAVPTAPRRHAAAPDGFMELAVVGAHMSGLPLNEQLTSRGGIFLRKAATQPSYRLFALPGGDPRRPGLLQVAGGAGVSIELEIWALPSETVGSFLAGIPAPLSIGTLQLADGTAPKGFLVEAAATADAEDVSELGGWRAFLAG